MRSCRHKRFKACQGVASSSPAKLLINQLSCRNHSCRLERHSYRSQCRKLVHSKHDEPSACRSGHAEHDDDHSKELGFAAGKELVRSM